MAPLLHCIRHAQGIHNLSPLNHQIRDPVLTPLGEAQCHTLSQTFPHHQTCDTILCSPIKRTLQTALLAFDRTLQSRHMTILALPELQETSSLPCDTGSSVSDLRATFPDAPVDWSDVPDEWTSKEGRWAPTTRAVQERARELRNWLRDRPEAEIVLVTHGGLLHHLTEDWDEHDVYSGTGWQNTEWRTYYFTSETPLAVEGGDAQPKGGGDGAALPALSLAAWRERRECGNPEAATPGLRPRSNSYAEAHIKELPESQQRRAKERKAADEVARLKAEMAKVREMSASEGATAGPSTKALEQVKGAA
jgi:broad specificity phosphatase PhoE